MVTSTNEQQVPRPQISQLPEFPFRIDKPPGPSENDLSPTLIEMARAVAVICATRILLLLTTLFAGAALVWTVFEPEPMRINALGVYAVLVLWPIVILNWKRG